MTWNKPKPIGLFGTLLNKCANANPAMASAHLPMSTFSKSSACHTAELIFMTQAAPGTVDRAADRK